MSLVKKNSFDSLIQYIYSAHQILQESDIQSVNQHVTIRNWLFGFYIVEYEQGGEDRAKYGENLIQEIAKKLTHIKGLRFRQLHICKNFYLKYPQFLRTLSAKLGNDDKMNALEIWRTASAEFNNKHYRIDLVFYHRILKCHVLLDLKLGEYDHTDAGQMTLYLNYFKDNEMIESDNPPIGLILCADKDDTLVKYTTPEWTTNFSYQNIFSNYPTANCWKTLSRKNWTNNNLENGIS